jgi:hypothetical protein
MRTGANSMMETPIYGVAEAAQYLRVRQNTLAYWLKGGGSVPPLIKLASAEPYDSSSSVKVQRPRAEPFS